MRLNFTYNTYMIEGDYLTENCSEILSDKILNTNIFGTAIQLPITLIYPVASYSNKGSISFERNCVHSNVIRLKKTFSFKKLKPVCNNAICELRNRKRISLPAQNEES